MKKIINKNKIGIVILVVLMLIFTFLDLPIAKVIYAPASRFGRFFEIIGTIPLPIVGIFCTVSLIMTAEKKFCVKTILSYVLSLALYPLFFMYGIKCVEHQVASARMPMTIASLLWTVASFFLVFKIIKNGKAANLRRAAIIGIVGGVVSTLLIGRVKKLFSRQRFYTLANPEEEFTYWFQIQPANELHDSFPSGHAGQAATSLFAILITSFVNVKDSEKFTKIMAVISVGFTVCVMLSRMVLGMHFATDVIIGAALPLISMRIAQLILEFTIL